MSKMGHRMTAADDTEQRRLPCVQQCGLCSLCQRWENLSPGGSPYSQARTRLSEENLSLTGNRSRVGNSWIPGEIKRFLCVASLRAVVHELSSCWSPGLFVPGLSSSFFLQSFR